MNMFKLLLAFLAVGSTSAFAPAMGAKLAQSKVAGARAEVPMPVAQRSAAPQMSAVTERDADGNPVTHYEMFDAIWMAIVLLPYTALLVTNPF